MVGDNTGGGTVRHERPSPAYGSRQSVAKRWPSAREILRDQRRRDLLASIAEFWHASGPDRRYWREQSMWMLDQWRTRYRNPERAAFQQAVERGRS